MIAYVANSALAAGSLVPGWFVHTREWQSPRPLCRSRSLLRRPPPSRLALTATWRLRASASGRRHRPRCWLMRRPRSSHSPPKPTMTRTPPDLRRRTTSWSTSRCRRKVPCSPNSPAPSASGRATVTVTCVLLPLQTARSSTRSSMSTGTRPSATPSGGCKYRGSSATSPASHVMLPDSLAFTRFILGLSRWGWIRRNWPWSAARPPPGRSSATHRPPTHPQPSPSSPTHPSP